MIYNLHFHEKGAVPEGVWCVMPSHGQQARVYSVWSRPDCAPVKMVSQGTCHSVQPYTKSTAVKSLLAQIRRQAQSVAARRETSMQEVLMNEERDVERFCRDVAAAFPFISVQPGPDVEPAPLPPLPFLTFRVIPAARRRRPHR